MRAFEAAAAAVFTALGVRSFVYWLRRPFDSTDPRDHVLFALFVVGRVGLWLSLAGLFAISLTLRNPDPAGEGSYLSGRAFADEFQRRFWWYPLFVVGFLILQFLGGFFLGRREPG